MARLDALLWAGFKLDPELSGATLVFPGQRDQQKSRSEKAMGTTVSWDGYALRLSVHLKLISTAFNDHSVHFSSCILVEVAHAG